MNLNEIIVTNILNAITVFSPKGRFETMTNRRSYGLSFTTNGQITYTLNGNSYISNKNYAVILPKGQSYTIYGNKDGKFPVINFECTNFFAEEIMVIPVKNIDYIYKDYEHLKKLLLFKEQRLVAMSIFYNILNTLSMIENYKSNPLMPALEYLENNYNRNITNSQLAFECKIGEEYFRKLFKKTYGISPKQYVTQVRIDKAKQMLNEGIFKINSISELCGFSNQYHFCRFFKQKTGLTPSEYMKKTKINKF